jgi:plastocyanin
MRKLRILVTAAALAVAVVGVGAVGMGPAGAKTTKPVSINGKVNVKGKKDISGKTSATIELEADDYYFNPTFVKVSPGEKVTVEFKNEGSTTHTFTSDTLNVDKQLGSDKSTKFTFTVPSDATAFQFHCSIHEDMGMKGAVYTKTGGTAK